MTAPSRRKEVAQSINDISDALAKGVDDEAASALTKARARLVLMLDDDEFGDKRVRRYDTGARVRVKMNRGDSPRDSDEWVLEAKGETPEDAQRQLDELLNQYVETWADEVRQIDPYGE